MAHKPLNASGNGKGSADRVSDRERYLNNFDAIDWSAHNAKPTTTTMHASEVQEDADQARPVR